MLNNYLAAITAGTISVFPNPASHVLQFELSGVVATKCKATLYDMMGRVVRQQQQALGNNSLNVGGIAEGQYILRVQAGDKRFTQSVVITR